MKKGKVAKLLEGRAPEVIASAILVHPKTVARWQEEGCVHLPGASIVAPLAVALGIEEVELRNAIYADRQARKQLRC